MKLKTRPAKIKANQDGDDEGVFEAIVATYDLDSVGDKIMPGAFEKSLATWSERGDPIPVLWSHMWDDPDYHIGVVEQAEERDEGLWVRARLDMDEPKSRKIFKLLKGGRVTQFSFAYDVDDGEFIEANDDEPGGYYALRQLTLYEVGPTLIGANQQTELLGVKSAIGQHETATSDAEWDGPANEARLSTDAGESTYREAYAWQDPDGDPDVKSSFKFIHHEVSENGEVGAASIQACTTAIGVLNGGRGGADIPDADRQGVYDHLARHLRDAEVEPPELASAPDAHESAGTSRVKTGRVLSAKNEGHLRDARDLINTVLSALESADTEEDSSKRQQAMPEPSAASEEPAGAKGDAPAGPGAASVLLRTDLDLLEAEVNADIPRG